MAPENTCSNNPIIAWKIFGHSESNDEIEKHFAPQDGHDCMEDRSTLNIVDLNPNQQYTFQLLAKNENGWSEPSEQFNIHIAASPPPENVRVSSKRTHSQIKVRWDSPASITLAYYEIAIVVPDIKLSATFTKLDQQTKYYFKVRTCNGFYTSDWSDEIEAKTRVHKAIKAALSPLVWAVGTVTSPLVMSLGAGAAAGKAVHETGGDEVDVTAGAGGGAVGGVALGIVVAPFVGGVWAHYFVHGMDELSDQSDDEGAIIIDEEM